MAIGSARPPAGRRWRRVVVQAGALVGCYFLLPLFESPPTHWLILRSAAAAGLLAVALALVVRTVTREARAADDEIRLDHLALAALGGVVCFAVIDFAIARNDPAQFTDLTTKTDALYFTLSTLSTAGFGDVSAQGQLARQVVMVQLVFNVVVLANAARELSRGMARRSRAARELPATSDGVVLIPGQSPDHRDAQGDQQH